MFVPPPPLPEEVDEQRARQDARIAALRAGTATPGDLGGPGGAPAAAGDSGEAAPGMSDEEIRAHAREAGDPRGGEFTLEEATAGLSGEGPLMARLKTSRGTMTCELFEDEAPRTVANFVGLARGLRPYKDPQGEAWVTGRYYDGTVFHRVIPGFMIQGGDPLGTGLGGAGYVLPEEPSSRRHDEAGMLSMANRGPGTGSSQFFITLGPTAHLDGRHTIFGQCDEAAVTIADDIAHTARDQNDKPLDPEVLESVTIFRGEAATDPEPVANARSR